MKTFKDFEPVLEGGVLEKMGLIPPVIAKNLACPKCGQTDHTKTGEYPCHECGTPTLWDAPLECPECEGRGCVECDGPGHRSKP